MVVVEMDGRNQLPDRRKTLLQPFFLREFGKMRVADIERHRDHAPTVVCVDVPGCEGGAILSTKQGGTVIFFSMATSFSAAALGAEGMAADVTMLVGNGYVPGHADLALDLIRRVPSVRRLFELRVGT